MTFEEYLVQKKIDSKAFMQAEESLWNEFNTHFDQQHPKSFTAQKLFLINGIRRKYPYTIAEQTIINTEKKVSRPVIKKRTVTEDVNTDQSESNAQPVRPKPVMKAKPVIKKSEEGSEEPAKKPKPIMKRPKMK